MNTTNLTWPCDRFYWAVLDVPGYRRSGPLPAALLVPLQDHVPIDVGELHAVAVPLVSELGDGRTLEDGRLLVCAARRDELDPLCTSDEVISLTAELVPDTERLNVVGTSGLRALNLLCGEFEPRRIRRARRRRHAELAVTVLVMSLLLSFGLHRRAGALSDTARDSQQTLASILAINATEGAAIDSSHVARRLDSEVQYVAQVGEVAGKVTPPLDASTALAALLRSWPTAIEGGTYSVQSISVNESVMSLSVVTESDATLLLRSLVAPAGWRIEEPRVSNVSGVSRVLLELRRTPSPKGAP